MRTETDRFEQIDSDGFFIEAEQNDDNIVISAADLWDVVHTILTKDQAREFARQLMEMCGEEG